MNVGLVVGKFYPPHSGHLELIDFALSKCEKVVVLVLGTPDEKLSPELRGRILTEHYQDLLSKNIFISSGYDASPFDLHSESVWSSHMELFKYYLAEFPKPTHLFSSEEYGMKLAEMLNIENVIFDLERIAHPISGTKVRKSLQDEWGNLPEKTKKHLALKVAFVGAESTGTTTISQKVTSELKNRGGVWSQTVWVPEHGKQVTVDKLKLKGKDALSADWAPNDFLEIAKSQQESIMSLSSTGSPILIADTDALATVIWEKRYLGNSKLEDDFEVIPADLYLLTSHIDVPFVQDGTRDGEIVRSEMTGWFADELIKRKLPWAVLAGTIEERVAIAMRIILSSFDKHFDFK